MKELDFDKENDREQLAEIERLVGWTATSKIVSPLKTKEYEFELIILNRMLHILELRKNLLGNRYLHRCFILDGRDCLNEVVKKGGWFNG